MSFGGGGGKKGSNEPSEKTSLANPIVFYKNKTGKYPSNAQIWWSMKRPPEMGTDRPPKQYLEVFDPALRHQVYTGNTPAAKGHFTFPAFRQDRSGVSGVPGLPVGSARGARPRAVGFYAGRVWYSGVLAPEYNTKVYYTQILERPEQVSECYQVQDPTAEDLRDLLPSDGGVVVIPEMVLCHHMMTIGQMLFLFADNGVWQIGGPDQGGFRANDYFVSKVSGAPTLSNMSFVDVEGLPIWWNRSDINTIAPNQQGQLAVQSLTDQTIKTFYNAIPEQSKRYAKGAYDPLTKTVQWLYRSTETDNEQELFVYDRILVLDVRSGAFSPWELSEFDRVQMKGLFAVTGEAIIQETVDVVANGDNVQANGSEVISFTERRELVQSKIKYIVNVLDDTGAPAPPDAIPIPHDEVFVGEDEVYANADQVIINP